MKNELKLVLNYQPDLKLLEKQFRKWHVESLLNQAATLMETCLDELKYYFSLEYAWHQWRLDQESQEKDLQLDQERAQKLRVHERDLLLKTEEKAFLNDSQGMLEASKFHAEKLYGLGKEEYVRTRDGQNLNEKEIEIIGRRHDHLMWNMQNEWAKQDSENHLKRLDIRSASLLEKRNLASPGQPFALNWQSKLVHGRIKRNYADAMNRACIANLGLETVYGYKTSIGPVPPETNNLGEEINHLAQWIRRSVEWLAAYAQLDQGFTRAFSIRLLVGEKQWNNVTRAKGHCQISFRIPSEAFALHENVRLRGISAMLVGQVGTVPWSIHLKLPQQAVYRRDGENALVMQDELPSCLLGRVVHYSAARPVEIAGQISLFNASPIGYSADGTASETWSLRVESGAREEFASLEDILLETHAVGVPSGGA